MRKTHADRLYYQYPFLSRHFPREAVTFASVCLWKDRDMAGLTPYSESAGERADRILMLDAKGDLVAQAGRRLKVFVADECLLAAFSRLGERAADVRYVLHEAAPRHLCIYEVPAGAFGLAVPEPEELPAPAFGM